ncbi:hypothetical protein SAMN04487969_105221 [Paenibacillus algorifonticola]|uniref:Tetratricopeptide repeat-containing protein n=1 Tax=Paenibacillus algorifonticola TaxID=684063 RepID=A0A1I2CQN6_9BACL|nr:hypothetical protein [Paenibacillus algorifonticola]SFE70667.1 hypothetical protein SAMN04487969_105221 [Paenibacillus algorifonticola]
MRFVKKTLIYILVAIPLILLLNYLKVEGPAAIVIIFLTFLAATLGPLFYTILGTRNLAKIERFLLANRNIPSYYINYTVAHRLDDEFEEMMGKLLKQYKQKNKQALFKTLRAHYNKDIQSAAQEIELIQPMEYRYYYQAYYYIERREFTEAHDHINRISKAWMKLALLSYIELKQGNRPRAIELAEEAMQAARGVQLYVMVKTFEREYLELRQQAVK